MLCLIELNILHMISAYDMKSTFLTDILFTDIEMAIVDKSLELSKHIQSLDLTLKSLKSLKLALPAYYMASVTRLEEQMRELMERAEENAAFFISIEEIRTDVSGWFMYSVVKSLYYC